MTKRICRALLFSLAVLVSGCSTTKITNLTPTRLPRKDNGLYSFSVEYYSRQATILRPTFKAFVLVGNDRYAMEPTPLLSNRWETLIPIPAKEDVVNYRYRFEFDYKAISAPRSAVIDSRNYQLYLLDR